MFNWLFVLIIWYFLHQFWICLQKMPIFFSFFFHSYDKKTQDTLEPSIIQLGPYVEISLIISIKLFSHFISYSSQFIIYFVDTFLQGFKRAFRKCPYFLFNLLMELSNCKLQTGKIVTGNPVLSKCMPLTHKMAYWNSIPKAQTFFLCHHNPLEKIYIIALNTS